MIDRVPWRHLATILVTSRRLALVLLAVLSALALAAAPALASGPAPTQPTARFEVDFMEDMIDHIASNVTTSASRRSRTV
ncbi:MAG: hypothetical protein HY329_08705 [Chloroflexi bacterium]|nr:hypothetical protein [Chloroflexota bacterium]